MSFFAILLGALSGVIIPMVQSDKAEAIAEAYELDESEVFNSHYWGGWFHDWTLLWVALLAVALVAWANKPAHFKWVLFVAFAGIAHLSVAYGMSWVIALYDAIAGYLGL